MDWRMYLNRVTIPAFETIDRCLSSVRGTIVGYPKDPLRRTIRFLPHNEIDQFVKTFDARTSTAQPKNFGLSNIPSCHVCQGPHPFIFMLNSAINAGFWSSYRCQPPTGLNTGFLIRGDNKIINAQRFVLPESMIQIENSCSLLFKLRISRPDPASVTPRANSISTSARLFCR